MSRHIVTRLQERYGMSIKPKQVEELETAARNGLVLRKAPHKSPETVEVAADWNGRAIICVLVGPEKRLVTVLPANDCGLRSKIRKGFFKVNRKLRTRKARTI